MTLLHKLHYTRHNHESLTVSVSPPTKPNGIIAKYILQLERQCTRHRLCDNRCANSWEVRMNATVDYGRLEHKFRNLHPYTKYRVKAMAENSGGFWSGWSEYLEETTRPTLKGNRGLEKKLTNFSIGASDKSLYVTLTPPCPSYLGSIAYFVNLKRCYNRTHYCQYDSQEKRLSFDMNTLSSDMTLKFGNLDMDKHFEVCVTVNLLSNGSNQACQDSCKSERYCGYAKTICTDNPEAHHEVSPRVEPWIAHVNDYDPFTQAKVMLPQGAFSGVSSATKYFLLCNG